MNGSFVVLIQGLFVLLSVLTIIGYLRRRDQARLDILLMFAVVAVAILAPAIQKLTGPKSQIVANLSAVFLLAHPYLILRLASYYRAVPRVLRYGTLAALAISVVLLFSLKPLPTGVISLIAACFLAGEVMAGVFFFQGAVDSGGVTRWRLGLASSGSVLLGAVIGLAGIGVLFASVKSFSGHVSLALAGLAALCYYFAFASPRWLQRLWQTRELLRFVEELGELPASMQIERVGEYLSRAAYRVIANCVTAGVGLPRNDDIGMLEFNFVNGDRRADERRVISLPLEDSLGKIWKSGQPETAGTTKAMSAQTASVARAFMADAAYCVPISARSHVWGMLIVFLRRQSLFIEDDLGLLKLMVRYASQVVDLRELVQTERELSERLKQAMVDAESANRAKSDFLANMSHELRTPLNSIIGFSEILSQMTLGELNPKQKRYMENIVTSGRHLLQLINDILDLSKIEAGRMSMQLEEIKSAETIQEVLGIVGSMANLKGIKLAVDLDENIPNVTADRAKFRQILYNLLSNAIKFTMPDGTATLRSCLIRGTSTEGTSDDQLRIEVVDTGIGIRSSDLPRLFGKFEQLDSSYAKKQQGTGLGLALTKRLVEMHGGRISVASDGEGKGSTFTVVIPVRGPVPAEEEIEVLSEAKRFESDSHRRMLGTVLVVEDDPQARELLTYHLEMAGYSVNCIADGRDAVRTAREINPIIITLDILLPKSDGWEILKELKSLSETRDIPVVVVSVTEDRELGLSLGASAFLLKPIVGGELIRTVNSIMKQAGIRTTAIKS